MNEKSPLNQKLIVINDYDLNIYQINCVYHSAFILLYSHNHLPNLGADFVLEAFTGKVCSKLG